MEKIKRMWVIPKFQSLVIISILRCWVKTVVLLAFIGGGPLVADPTQSCPPLLIEAICDGSVAKSVVMRPANYAASNLSFALTEVNAQGPSGAQALRLKKGQSANFPVSAAQLPITMAVVGFEESTGVDDSACCFSNQSIDVVNLCPADDVTAQVPDETELSELDVAIELQLSETCDDGMCEGMVELTGDVPANAQISFSATPAIVHDIQADGGLKCDTTKGAILCGWDAPSVGDVVFKIPRSQPKGTFEVCAQIGVAEEPRLRAMALQKALNAQGFSVGTVDGLIGPATRAALAKMKDAAGIADGETMLPDEAMITLGLGDYKDENMANNRVCAITQIPKPPLVCDKRTTIQGGDACVCRLRNMVRTSETTCACPKGTVSNGAACVKAKKVTPKPDVSSALVCDRNTAVQRGKECGCCYEGMRKSSATTCRCSSGLPPLPGVGCINITLSLPGGDDKP
ncbi:MAG: peptidoglycan-binding domain-containing protein [Ascidiaceihabitans sp.]|nr:peptidoglycan-binding domain-containing protein [Ascidiaceihabitans sp.]